MALGSKLSLCPLVQTSFILKRQPGGSSSSLVNQKGEAGLRGNSSSRWQRLGVEKMLCKFLIRNYWYNGPAIRPRYRLQQPRLWYGTQSSILTSTPQGLRQWCEGRGWWSPLYYWLLCIWVSLFRRSFSEADRQGFLVIISVRSGLAMLS